MPTITITGKRRDEVARILEMVANDGLSGPRDVDVAIDAIESAMQWPDDDDDRDDDRDTVPDDDVMPDTSHLPEQPYTVTTLGNRRSGARIELLHASTGADAVLALLAALANTPDYDSGDPIDGLVISVKPAPQIIEPGQENGQENGQKSGKEAAT